MKVSPLQVMEQIGGFYRPSGVNMTYNPAARGTPAIARAASRLALNNSGGLVLKATPVRLTPTGMFSIDVSIESEALAIAGLVRADTADTATGEVISGGLLENISTSATIGDIMYVSKLGDLTNVKPSLGVSGYVAGDWVIRAGVVAKNSDNPLLKDLLVNIQIIGEL